MEEINSQSLFFQDFNQFSLLSEEEEKEIFEKYLTGDKKAQDLLINSNLKLIYSIAKKFSVQSTALSTLDLVQEGVIGFINGLKHYDPTYGCRLNTYVVTWVKQAISRSIANISRNVDIPVYMIENINKYHKAQEAIGKKKGESGTDLEVANFLQWPLEKVKIVQQYLYDTTSLDAKISDDNDETLGDSLKDITESPEILYEKKALSDKINDILDTLPEREAKILRMRFGIGYSSILTLEEVGKAFNISKERARQLENNALKMMRNPYRTALIQDFLY